VLRTQTGAFVCQEALWISAMSPACRRSLGRQYGEWEISGRLDDGNTGKQLRSVP